MAGCIYILINSAMPGYLKIGMSTRTAEDRARELSQGTAVVVPFSVAFSEEVADCLAAERLIHAHLDSFRVNPGREFFHLPLQQAIRAVLDIVEVVGRPTIIPPTNVDAIHGRSLTQVYPPSFLEEVAYSLVKTHSAREMAPRLSQEKLRHLVAMRDAVLFVCPDCLWRMRGDGKIVFTPPHHQGRAKLRNLMTLHLQERPIRFRISDDLNRRAGGEAEKFDESRLAEIKSRLAALLARRNGIM